MVTGSRPAESCAVGVNALTKHFQRGKPALRGVSLEIARGEMVALIGASGSGKSTLIRHIAGLLPADRGVGGGTIEVLGQEVQAHGRIAGDVRRLRARVGVIFQQFNLVGRLSLLTNVLIGVLGQIPAWRGCLGLFTRAEKGRAMQALARVEMAAFAMQRASTLSGGQQQRGAIARAMMQRAEVILADEPIASLDPASARRVMDALEALNTRDGVTILVSIHQVDYAIRYCPRTIALRDGAVVYDGPSHRLTPEFLADLYGSEHEDLVLGRMNAPAAGPQRRAREAAVAGG